jgi:hypothetical protein
MRKRQLQLKHLLLIFNAIAVFVLVAAFAIPSIAAASGASCNDSYDVTCDDPCLPLVTQTFYCCNTDGNQCCQRNCFRTWCEALGTPPCEGGPYVGYDVASLYQLPCKSNGQCSNFDPGS